MNAKLAIITGASAGIGLACAEQLAQDGFDLLLIARNHQRLTEVSSRIAQAFSVRCDAISLDMSDKASVTQIIGHLEQSGRTVDVLVNNAGGAEHSAKLEDLSEADWLHTFNINFFVVVELCQRLLPFMIKNGTGRVINISSITANTPGLFNPHYSAAKAAVNNFSKHLANLAGPKGITVNVVSPGVIETLGWQNHMKKAAQEQHQDLTEFTQSAREQASQSIPMARLGEAHEVAGLVSFLASEKAAYITGAEFTVDGGKRKEI